MIFAVQCPLKSCHRLLSGKMAGATEGQETGQKGHCFQRSQVAYHVVLGEWCLLQSSLLSFTVCVLQCLCVFSTVCVVMCLLCCLCLSLLYCLCRDVSSLLSVSESSLLSVSESSLLSVSESPLLYVS